MYLDVKVSEVVFVGDGANAGNPVVVGSEGLVLEGGGERKGFRTVRPLGALSP